MIALSTGQLRVEVDVERGAEIARVGRPEGPNMLARYDWEAPLPASRSVSYGSSGLDWHAAYRGGWQELFPNAGEECVVAGVPLPFHGEVSTARWEVVSSAPRELVARTAGRLPLMLERVMRLDPAAPVLTMEETVTNQAAFPIDYIWGHHPAFATTEESVIDLPGATIHADPDFDPDLNDLAPGATGR